MSGFQNINKDLAIEKLSYISSDYYEFQMPEVNQLAPNVESVDNHISKIFDLYHNDSECLKFMKPTISNHSLLYPTAYMDTFLALKEKVEIEVEIDDRKELSDFFELLSQIHEDQVWINTSIMFFLKG